MSKPLTNFKKNDLNICLDTGAWTVDYSLYRHCLLDSIHWTHTVEYGIQ